MKSTTLWAAFAVLLSGISVGAYAQIEEKILPLGGNMRPDIAPFCWDKSYWGLKGNVQTVTIPDQENPYLPPLKLAFSEEGKLTEEDGYKLNIDEKDNTYAWYKLQTVKTARGSETRNSIKYYVFDANRTSCKRIVRKELTLQSDRSWKLDNSVEYTLTHDAQGRVTSISDGAVPFYYDANGRLNKYGSAVMEWNEKGQLLSFRNDGEELITGTVTYDARGLLVKCVQVTKFKNYDTGKLTGKGMTTTHTFTYTLDSQGNWTKAVWKENGKVRTTIERAITYYAN